MTDSMRMCALILLSGFSCLCNASDDFNAVNSVESRATSVLTKYLSHTTEISGTAEIHFIESEALDWMDASLGCPQPGRSYDQVITPGHRVILAYQNQYYNVHLSAHHGLICTRPDGILPAPSH